QGGLRRLRGRQASCSGGVTAASEREGLTGSRAQKPTPPLLPIAGAVGTEATRAGAATGGEPENPTAKIIATRTMPDASESTRNMIVNDSWCVRFGQPSPGGRIPVSC